MKKLNIFVYGSFDGKDKQIKQLCRNLGKSFYEKGHTICIVTTNKSTIDRYFIEGVRFVRKSESLIKIYRDKRNTDIDKQLLINIPYNYTGTDKERIKIAHIQALIDADVVLTIAGNQDDGDISKLVEKMKKPIIVINSFDGSCKELFDRVDYFYKEFFNDKEYKLLTSLKSINSENCDMLVKMTEKISKSNLFFNYRKSKKVYLISLIIFWFLLFFIPSSIDYKFNLNILIVLLLFISGSIGIIGRSIYFIKIKQKEPLDTMMLMPAGIVLTFSYALIYFTTWYTLSNNDSQFLTSSYDYMRLGIAGSLSIFTASFFLEKAILFILEKVKL